MLKRTLITSFDTWLPEQASNASDDLLALLLHRGVLGNNVHTLRRLPVQTDLASQLVISAINHVQPDLVLCLGMASHREWLSLESTGHDFETEQAYTTMLDLEQLCRGLAMTEVSHHAGTFVCNGLYCNLLKYLRMHNPATDCLFLHVPVLTIENQAALLADCIQVLQRLQVCG
ncbi:MAG: peptidase C15 [Cyanobacteria bacterium]|nr:peptidase C15 [Cyanobacteriota bacterium]MDW8200012.1 peptidase C15 [Cyanobacteriota bacterium SKYGB_h_bin112]